MDWHNMRIEDIKSELKVDLKDGLSSEKARKLQGKFGKNVLKEKERPSFIKKLLWQFSDFMVLTLLAASFISFVTAVADGSKNYADPVIILFIVLVNAIIGIMQENKAEKAIDSLKKLSAPHAKVVRDGKQISILSEDVVPGDIMLLNAGDLVAADARIIEAHDLKAEESSLTGESVAVSKSVDFSVPKDTPLQERKNMLFATSCIISGHARAVVVETGMNTQVGKIAKLINEEDSPQTPLQERLAHTGKILGIGIIIISVVIFILGLIQGTAPLEMFMISISLAVAAIPEGLPAVVTIVLAIGVRKMAAKNAIVRRLPAVETLGSATVICSDKTGTLTQNKMSVTEIRNTDGKEKADSIFGKRLIKYASLCSDSKLEYKSGEPIITGEPTENAILTIAESIFKSEMNQIVKDYKRLKEIPFDPARKLMTTVHSTDQKGNYLIITKGAPDVLIKKCRYYQKGNSILPLDDDTIQKIGKNNSSMAEGALRVLAVAYKNSNFLPQTKGDTETDLTFLGLIGITDPPRPEAEKAIRECLNAGIKPVMITGDHPVTAKAIAKQLGILSSDSQVMTGQELDKLDSSELEKKVFDYSVFSRVSPQHKVMIVKAFQANGAVVAMTGDGVNDAPALKISNIGCAMGMSGTDVAKSAADIVLADDNFSTIVEAIRQGRGIFENIRKSVHFLLSTNIGEIIAVLVAFLLKMPSPLIAIQLLWINLVTDSFPALALGMEPIDKNIMNRKPIGPKKSLFSDGIGYNIFIEGSFIGIISLLAFTIGRVFFDVGLTPCFGRTMAFAVLGLSQLIHSFNVRSDKPLSKTTVFGNMKLIYSFILCAFLQISVISIPALNVIFKTKCLNAFQWLIVGLLSLSPLAISELEKFISAFRYKKSVKSLVEPI